MVFYSGTQASSLAVCFVHCAGYYPASVCLVSSHTWLLKSLRVYLARLADIISHIFHRLTLLVELVGYTSHCR